MLSRWGIWFFNIVAASGSFLPPCEKMPTCQKRPTDLVQIPVVLLETIKGAESPVMADGVSSGFHINGGSPIAGSRWIKMDGWFQGKFRLVLRELFQKFWLLRLECCQLEDCSPWFSGDCEEPLEGNESERLGPTTAVCRNGANSWGWCQRADCPREAQGQLATSPIW